MNDQNEENVWVKRKQERDASRLSVDWNNFPSVIGSIQNITFPSIIVCGVNVPSVIVLEEMNIPSIITVTATGA